MSLQVSEIYKSIQGESTYAGLPCVFVRLGGCNLSCSYCDTSYAKTDHHPMEAEDILDDIARFRCSLVEVTGGEPLLQSEAPLLLEELLGAGYTVLVETNGTIDISCVPQGVVRIVDIKCPASGMSDKVLWENVEQLGPTDEVKFVLCNQGDYQWAREIIKEHNLEDRCTVLLSPAYGKLPLAEIAEWMLADNLRARLQIQMHKIIWPDDTRGR